MRPLPENAVIRGSVVAPLSNGGVPQLPTREEYAVEKALRAQMRAEGAGPAAIANGGTIIADAYSEA